MLYRIYYIESNLLPESSVLNVKLPKEVIKRFEKMLENDDAIASYYEISEEEEEDGDAVYDAVNDNIIIHIN